MMDRRRNMDAPETQVPLQKAGGRRSPVWIASGAIALLVVVLLGYALLTGTTLPPQAGGAVPGFRLAALDGREMDLHAQRGKVVVLNIFASWCAPCRQEAEELEQAWRAYRGKDVVFYGIAYKDAPSKAQAFLEEFGVTYPSAVDPGNRTARAYGVTGVPETFIIDQQGNLVHHFLGPITQRDLSLQIERLLGLGTSES
jgi:cytochrome c biogenesis protein CcmG, thiol:disulfide interchange protein DsbE